MLKIEINSLELNSSAAAEDCILDIHRGLEQAKEGLYRLWIGGWKMLFDADDNEYSSFHAMLSDRFAGRSLSYLYRLKDVRVVERELSQLSPTGETISLKGTHVRELKKLTTSDKRADALSIARELSQVEGLDEPVVRHIVSAVKQVQQKDEIETSSHHVMTHLLTQGKLSLDVAAQSIEALDKLTPQLQYDVQAMISQAGGLRDAGLIPELAQMIKRKSSENESLVLQWIEETGDVFDVRLKDATLSDLKKAKDEAQRVRIAEAAAKKRKERQAAGLPVVEEILCTIYKGDAPKTQQTLKRLLGDDYGELRDIFVNEWLKGE
jgi:hypothetical protein